LTARCGRVLLPVIPRIEGDEGRFFIKVRIASENQSIRDFARRLVTSNPFVGGIDCFEHPNPINDRPGAASSWARCLR
jgi:hypothetical protein